jgi:hypothetical protein
LPTPAINALRLTFSFGKVIAAEINFSQFAILALRNAS